jgi:hypothetical protein
MHVAESQKQKRLEAREKSQNQNNLDSNRRTLKIKCPLNHFFFKELQKQKNHKKMEKLQQQKTCRHMKTLKAT